MSYWMLIKLLLLLLLFLKKCMFSLRTFTVILPFSNFILHLSAFKYICFTAPLRNVKVM